MQRQSNPPIDTYHRPENRTVKVSDGLTDWKKAKELRIYVVEQHNRTTNQKQLFLEFYASMQGEEVI